MFASSIVILLIPQSKYFEFYGTKSHYTDNISQILNVVITIKLAFVKIYNSEMRLSCSYRTTTCLANLLMTDLSEQIRVLFS